MFGNGFNRNISSFKTLGRRAVEECASRLVDNKELSKVFKKSLESLGLGQLYVECN
jgi:hypothetical protein